MQQLRKIVLLQGITFITGTIVFVLLFQTSFLSRVVLFYRGIIFLVFVSIGVTVGLIGIKKKGICVFDYRDILLSVVMFFCIGLVFFTHIPVTADRSLSVFLLGYMNTKTGSVITKEELSSTLIDTYIKKNQALEKRLYEQTASGTIVHVRNGYTITRRGIFLMHIYDWITDIFHIGKKNLSVP